MELSVWTYEGPPHVGAMRIATSMQRVHLLLHAPQGDTYADLLFTMIERRKERPPVTYTTFAARDLGSDTAALFQEAARAAYERFQPDVLMVAASCTAELIQDDPGGIAASIGLPVPVVPLDLSAYQRKENWGAAHALYKLVRACCAPEPRPRAADRRPCCNLVGPTALGFRHRDDVLEVTRLLAALGVDINVVAPLDATPADLARIGDADFNVVMVPEVADMTVRWLGKTFDQPAVAAPFGVTGTRQFIAQVAELAGTDPASLDALDSLDAQCRLPWYSRSIDSTYLTGKQVYVFGDATHVIAAARIATEELGFSVVGMGSYSREQARAVRAAAKQYGVEALITEDHLAVEEQIAALQPEIVLGTQMERHIAKRLGLPCAVISAPVHVHDYPARYSPQMGFEGANVLFDTWVHPLMMGLEEHLLGMFRDDFEFADHNGPSHLGAKPTQTTVEPEVPTTVAVREGSLWTAEAEKELKKIPFFVRGKARRNTERFAREAGRIPITLETLYDAKAHFQA